MRALPLSFWLLACGSSQTILDAATPDGGGLDGGALADAGTDAASSPDAGPLSGYGHVFATTGLAGTKVQAGFVRSIDGTNGCQPIIVDGACRIETCMNDNGPPPPPSAGTITVMSGSRSLVVTPVAGVYNDLDGPTPLWSGTASVHISAPGLDVPAFDQSFDAPLTPTLTAALPASVMLSMPLTLSWAGGGGGDGVVIAVAAGATSAKCLFDATAGTGTVPASTLAHFNPGAAELVVMGEHHRVPNAGGWAIRMATRTLANAGGADAMRAVTLQ